MNKLGFAVITLAVGAASAAVTWSLQDSDNAIARKFTAALNESASPILSGAVASNSAAAPVAGSEEFWLSALRAKDAAGLRHTVAIGDRLTLSLSGKDEVFEVQSVAELPAGVTYVGQTAPHVLMVTARKPGDAAGKLLRFVIEQAPGTELHDAAQARAL